MLHIVLFLLTLLILFIYIVLWKSRFYELYIEIRYGKSQMIKFKAFEFGLDWLKLMLIFLLHPYNI